MADAGDRPSTPAPETGAWPGGSPPSGPAPLEVTRTRTSTTYVGVAVALVLLILVLIFVVQNLHEASVHFLPFHFRMPLGVAILAAAVAGGVVVLLISLARVLQLRLVARRHRSAHERRSTGR